MAYLRCPNCGITVFDRNPLVPPGRCPRCAVRDSARPHLERVLQLRGGAAGSMISAPTDERWMATDPPTAVDDTPA